MECSQLFETELQVRLQGALSLLQASLPRWTACGTGADNGLRDCDLRLGKYRSFFFKLSFRAGNALRVGWNNPHAYRTLARCVLNSFAQGSQTKQGALRATRAAPQVQDYICPICKGTAKWSEHEFCRESNSINCRIYQANCKIKDKTNYLQPTHWFQILSRFLIFLLCKASCGVLWPTI